MRTKCYFAWGAVILVAAAVASLVAALPAQEAFCSVCGAREETRAWELRIARVTLREERRVNATPISTILTAKRLVGGHQHRWQPPQTVPDPMDEFGPPVVESLGFLNTPRIVNLTRDIADYADPRSARQWRELLLEPRYSYVLDGALRFLKVPPAGFADRTEFLTWWGEHSFAVYNRLREVTEPD